MVLGTYPWGDTLLELRVKPEGGDKTRVEGGVQMDGLLEDSGTGSVEFPAPFTPSWREGSMIHVHGLVVLAVIKMGSQQKAHVL